MGSNPILTETPPLSSSKGRALQHKAHLAKYCAGGAKVAHLAHYQKTTFESFARNQRNYVPGVNTDFVGFNYHRQLLVREV